MLNLSLLVHPLSWGVDRQSAELRQQRHLPQAQTGQQGQREAPPHVQQRRMGSMRQQEARGGATSGPYKRKNGKKSQCKDKDGGAADERAEMRGAAASVHTNLVTRESTEVDSSKCKKRETEGGTRKVRLSISAGMRLRRAT